jgi:hypothetical protein
MKNTLVLILLFSWYRVSAQASLFAKIREINKMKDSLEIITNSYLVNKSDTMGAILLIRSVETTALNYLLLDENGKSVDFDSIKEFNSFFRKTTNISPLEKCIAFILFENKYLYNNCVIILKNDEVCEGIFSKGFCGKGDFGAESIRKRCVDKKNKKVFIAFYYSSNSVSRINFRLKNSNITSFDIGPPLMAPENAIKFKIVY